MSATVIELTRQREAAGWTKSELARRARVHYPRVGAIESQMVVPYRPELRRLARALKWAGDPADLLRETAP